MNIISREIELNQIKKATLIDGKNVFLKGEFGSGKTSIGLTLSKENEFILALTSWGESFKGGVERSLQNKPTASVVFIDEAGYLLNGEYGDALKWILGQNLHVILSTNKGVDEFIQNPNTAEIFSQGFVEITLTNGDLRESSENRNPMVLR